MDKLRTSHASPTGWLLGMALLGVAVAEVSLDAGIDRVGTEYSVLGPQIGDQFFPQVSVGLEGGYLVWQDNNTDQEGLGIRAVRLDGNLNAHMGAFRVNETGKGDQQRPVLTHLPEGGAAFAWESGDDVFIRFVGSDGVFLGGEQKVNSYLKSVQKDPSMTTLDNGHVVVVWSSLDQDGDMQGVYGQLFDSKGNKVGAEFFVNQSVFFNQRSPKVTALSEGDFVVAWISEQFAGVADRTDQEGRIPEANGGGDRYLVTLMGRIFDENGLGVSDELELGQPEYINANPALVTVDGGFMAFYSARENVQRVSHLSEIASGWDIVGQVFTETGKKVGEPIVVNDHRYGDQVVPAVASIDGGALVAWTSLGQDGSQEGVFAKLLQPSTGQQSQEFQVNYIFANKQFLPSVGADGEGNALIVWSSFVGGVDSFDLEGQKYSTGNPLPVLEAPFVFGTGYWSLWVSWPELACIEIDWFEIYLDGNETPVRVSGNYHTFSVLNAATRHSVELAYVLPDGSRSPKSAPSFGSTWGRDLNFDQLPDDWQKQYFGTASIDWPKADMDSDGDGATNLEELLAGTDPADATSLLSTEVVTTPTGMHLRWNTQPGGVYQLQVSTDVSSWFDTGAPRLAVEGFDSVSIVNDQGIAVYRVLRLR